MKPELKKFALLGTQHLDKTELSSVLEFGVEDSLEAHILQQAGTQALYKELGQLPKQQMTARVFSPSGNESLNPCPLALSACLSAMLDGRHTELLSETLRLMREKEVCLPELTLPHLLDRASKIYALRPALLPVMGQAGRWLAAQHSSWRYAAEAEFSWAHLQDQWRSAIVTTRQGILFQARLQNPEMALSLVDSTWKSEMPAAGTWIIRQFELNLSMADEPFLERALDDRNVTVRRKAADLLSRLPDSRLALRMTEVAKELIFFDEDRFNLKFPETPEPSWARDGMMLRNWSNPQKVQAAQLTDLLSSVPLAYWEEQFQASPQELINSALNHQAAEAFVRGFSLAAERQQNEAWASLLVKEDKLTTKTIKLVMVLGEDAFCDLATHLAELDETQAFIKAFSRWSHTWTKTITELWLERLEPHATVLSRDSKTVYLLKSGFKQAARLVPQSHFKDLLLAFQKLKASNESLNAPIEEALNILYFRERLYAAFTGSSFEANV